MQFALFCIRAASWKCAEPRTPCLLFRPHVSTQDPMVPILRLNSAGWCAETARLLGGLRRVDDRRDGLDVACSAKPRHPCRYFRQSCCCNHMSVALRDGFQTTTTACEKMRSATAPELLFSHERPHRLPRPNTSWTQKAHRPSHATCLGVAASKRPWI